MRKRLLIRSLVVVAVVGLLAWTVPEVLEWWRYRQASTPLPEETLSRFAEETRGKAIAGQTSMERLDYKQNMRLAIGGLGVGDADLNGRVSDLLLAQLAGEAGLEIVERQELNRVLRELDLSAVGLVRASVAIRAGRLLRADWFLLGSPTQLSGTNFTVVRIVSARTGILRDAEVFQSEKPPTQLAAELAGFVRRCRKNAAAGIAPVYLSVGGFADLSVNSRQAELPTQLRSYLTAAYQKSGLTMLEREFANTLLQEAQLDLAAITDESPTNAAMMQSAYWMVDGSFQSYETTDFEVEIVFNMRRLFGKSHQIMLRGKPGEALFKQAKERIDTAMDRDRAALAPSRVTEVNALMSKGKELARLANVGVLFADVYQRLDDAAAAIQRRNVEEALRAFQTVLLLSPTNREAKMYVAGCLRSPSLRRDWEAREIYREILAEPVADKWVGQAQQALAGSFDWLTSAEEKARWFAEASLQGSNSPAVEFYRQNAQKAANAAAIANGNGLQVVGLAEQELREAIRSTRDFMQGKGGRFYGDYGISNFRRAFKGDHHASAAALMNFLPKVEKEFPELMPHLIAQVLYYQTETNTPLVTEFLKKLDACRERPGEIFAPREFWNVVRYSAYEWLMNSGFANEAVRTMESYKTSAEADGGRSYKFEERDWVALGYAFMWANRWQDALEVFAPFTNKSVRMPDGGPWGNAFTIVNIDALSTKCREKLGQTVERDAFERDLVENKICLHDGADFTATFDGLWLAAGKQLLKLGFDLRTNLMIDFPRDSVGAVSCIAVSAHKVWVGTKGGGIVECDTESRRTKRLTEVDGLMMNHISSLAWDVDRLWIGYGGDAGGGLGLMNVSSGKVSNFMRSLDDFAIGQPSIQPPKASVQSIYTDSSSRSVFLLAGSSGLYQYHVDSNHWGFIPSQSSGWMTCVSIGPNGIVAGHSVSQIELKLTQKTHTALSPKPTRTVAVSPAEERRLRATLPTNGTELISGTSVGAIRPKGEIASWNPATQDWRMIGDTSALPAPPTAILEDGGNLWVGGEGYLVFFDLQKSKIGRRFSIPAQRVDRVEVGGGYFWVKYNEHLHRALLQNLR